MLTVDTMRAGSEGPAAASRGAAQLFRRPQVSSYWPLACTRTGDQHLIHLIHRMHLIQLIHLIQLKQLIHLIPSHAPRTGHCHALAQVTNTLLLLFLWPITALGYYGLALSMSSLGNSCTLPSIGSSCMQGACTLPSQVMHRSIPRQIPAHFPP